MDETTMTTARPTEEGDAMPTMTRFSHVSLSVRDVAVSAAWYCDVLGFEFLEELTGESWYEKVVVHPCGAVLTLQQHFANGSETFDPVRTGMDHFAFLVSSEEELDAWDRRLTELGVEHSSPIAMPYGTVLSLKDPDRIAIELFWRPNHP